MASSIFLCKECTRGGFCNFMHLRPISQNLQRQLYGRGPRRSHPRGSILATVPERGTIGVPLITGMAASEALAPLPSYPSPRTGTNISGRTSPQSPLHSPGPSFPGSIM
ncbi:hypothetical protein H8959_005598 [Pygathrix nigripes]